MSTAAFQPILTQAGLNAAARAQAEDRVLSITHIALGTGAYAPTGLETTLAAETTRAPIHRRKHLEGASWQVAATLVGQADYFAREVGFFADDDGTPVLLFVFSSPDRVFAAVTEGQETLLELAVSLAAMPEGTVEIAFLDAGISEQQVLDDLSGEHLPGNNFNFALTRGVEAHQFAAMEQFEALAEVRRSYGQSGINFGRHYSLGGDAAYHRPGYVSFAALGVHDHPNYPLMCGMPEISAVVNGYAINTRHVDYRIMHGVGGGAYLEVDDAVPPSVPASVLAQSSPEDQITEMREYLRAFGAKDPGIRDYRDHFDTYLSALEVWLEVLDGEDLVDTFPSFRHQLSSLGLRSMNDDYLTVMASGLKTRYENVDFKPTVVRVMRADGKPQFGVLRYRVSAVRLGSYRDYPAHEMVALVDDPAARHAWNNDEAAQEANRRGRYRVRHALGDDDITRRYGPGLLDEIMGTLPGLDGPGAVIEEAYTDTHENGGTFTQNLQEFKTTDPMNSAVYRRFYSYALAGAAGRRDYRFGFNDPTLFRAATTRPEVVALPGMGGGHRLSWAIPMELIVATPLSRWNPYDVAEGPWPSGDGNTPATAYSNARAGGRWYRTPDVLFSDGGGGIDPADTTGAAWMICGDGQARLMRGSGVYVHLPEIAGVQTARTRWPIAPGHHDGSPVMAHLEGLRRDQQAFMAAVTAQLLDMKHTA